MSGHSHNHSHGHDLAGRRLGWAVAINLGLTVVQVVGGIMAGSLSLIADALHNFSDAAGMILALAARRISRRPPDADRTFGYGRAEVVGALINLTAILVISMTLVIEAVTRMFDRPPVDGWIVVIVAGVALVIDAATAVLTYSVSKDSVNIRAAFLHNLGDAMASVGVIVSGTLIILYDWYWADLIATVGISAAVAWMSWAPMKRCIAILMQSVPQELSTQGIEDAMVEVPGVRAVFHIHLWPIDEKRNSLEARVVIDDQLVSQTEAIGRAIRERIDARFGIDHLTLEFRTSAPTQIDGAPACDDAAHAAGPRCGPM